MKPFILLALLCGTPNFAQVDIASVANERSAAPADVRYEFVMSEIAAKGTFRIDKFRGIVSKMVVDDKGVRHWQPIIRLAHSQDTMIKADSVNYQLFTSGIAMKHTYLMNVNTGATWQLVVDQSGVEAWGPID